MSFHSAVVYYKWELAGTALFCLAVYIAYLSPVHCVFKYITGIDCMSCGLTRAITSALRFDFKTAFYCHPLWFTVPFIWLSLFFRRRIPEKAFVIWMLAVLSAFAVTYVLRLFFIPDSLIYIGV